MAGERRWRGWGMVLGLPLAAAIAAAAFFWPRGGARLDTRPPAAKANQVPLADCLARMPVKIAQHVYLLGDMRPSAVYVVETDEGLALVDAGLESAHETLLAGLAKLNLDVARLKMILLTHAHGDHSMGAEQLRKETGAKIYIGRGDAEPLRRGGPWEAVFSKFQITGESLHPTTIDGELTDEQVIRLGQASFTVIATPGHTPGSCCFLLEVDGERSLFTGDTISTFTVGSGTYSVRLPSRYRGDIEDYLHSLEKLRKLPAPDLVLPGHPASDLASIDPHVTQADWQALVDRELDDLAKLNDRYERDGKDFLDGSPKPILEGLYYLGELKGRAAYALVSGERALVFNGAHGEGAVEELEKAWKTLGVAPPAVSVVALTSCEAEDLAGLESLAARAPFHVVAPAEGLEAVAASCPSNATAVTVDALPGLGWEGIDALAISGAGGPQAAYVFVRRERTVLVSGALPIDADAEQITNLARGGPPPGWQAQRLAGSLERLAKLQPDVWLSSAPWRGRSANLYDRSWTNILTLNRQLLRRW